MSESTLCRTLARGPWMMFGLAISAIAPQTFAGSFDHTHNRFTEILQEHVEYGRVDYANLQANRSPLDAYLKNLASVSLRDFQSWSTSQQLAFLLNLYNAETLQLILDHYPVDSIKDIGGFFTKPWDLKTVELFGRTVTLDAVEHDMIRKNYREPRIHFALVCAARGCPPLRSEAYRAEVLDDQLDDQAQKFLQDAHKNRLDLSNNTLYLSPIFKWYKQDFENGSKGVQYFLSDYYPKDLKQSLRRSAFTIRYTDYDWALNDK